MGNRKHIDRLFQERFKDFEATPDKAVWENIHKELKLQQHQEDERRIIPFWLKLSGIAASLVLLISLGLVLFSDSEQSSNSIVSPNESENTSLDPISKENNAVVKTIPNKNSDDTNSIKGHSNTTIASDQQHNLKENQEHNTLNNTDYDNDRFVSNNNQSRFNNNTKKTNNKNGFNDTETGFVNSTNNTNKENSNFNKRDIKKNLEKDQNNVIANNNKANDKSGLSQNSNPLGSENNSITAAKNNSLNTTPNLVNTNKNVIATNASDTKSDSNNEQSTTGFNTNKIKSAIDKSNNITNKSTVENNNKVKEEETILNNKTKDSSLVQNKNINNQTYPVTDTQNNVINKENGDTILEQQNKTNQVVAQTDSTPDTTEEKKEDTQKEEETPEEKTIEDAIADQEQIKEENEDDDEENALFKKWNVAPNIAPVYYNSLSSGSPIDEQFKSNPKKGQINVSYGINVSYALNKKLKLRSGINRLEVGYNTENVAILPAEEATGDIIIKNIDLSSAATELNIGSSNGFAVSQIPASFESLFDASLEQQFGYLEVPLELSYKLTDKKLSINVIGGVSSFFLNKNEVYAKNSGNTTYLGKANNLNDVSFSTNIGLGFNYKISKAFNLNFEPVFKYQLNSFSKDAGNFRPYILGVYSGLSFKF